MPGSNTAGAVSWLLHQKNFASIIMIPADEAETEAYQASEDLNAHIFRKTLTLSEHRK